MTLCALCGSPGVGQGGLCAHHICGGNDNWARGNRVLCDLLHRRKLPARLPKEERDDEFWAESP